MVDTAQEQWEKLQELGVKAGHMFRPDPDIVLTFTAPDSWTPGQHEELQAHLAAWFPDNRVVVYSESIALDVTRHGIDGARPDLVIIDEIQGFDPGGHDSDRPNRRS